MYFPCYVLESLTDFHRVHHNIIVSLQMEVLKADWMSSLFRIRPSSGTSQTFPGSKVRCYEFCLPVLKECFPVMLTPVFCQIVCVTLLSWSETWALGPCLPLLLCYHLFFGKICKIFIYLLLWTSIRTMCYLSHPAIFHKPLSVIELK